MHDLLNKRTVVSTLPTPTGTEGGPVAFTSTGDKFIFTPAMPCDVYRWGLITDALLDVGAGFTIALDWRPTAGSDTNRAQKDTIVKTADVAAGQVLYSEAVGAVAQATGSDGSLVDVAPAGPVEVDPGEELVIEVTDAADTAGTGYVWIEYVEKPLAGSRAGNATNVNA